ncbi:hypothetical protein [Lignipirellula cremea]|uniref:Uncharacterized protein n=1 Tax=Lignipirellula cremea TaxID=2528010 RepID=A0A518DY35_9BACT|nr:hypothetical protein [Lignipirellula cremea]QDU96705.1 hypothetical protein Pla8534_45260 [Lignipirellula cremea]
MGFLKRFFKNVFHEGAPSSFIQSSFEHLSEDELDAHLGITRYDNFELTDAVRPSYDVKVKPTQGYRRDSYFDEESKAAVPVLMASATKDLLFEVFLELLGPLGHEVDVVLETSHGATQGHVDLYRESIDMPVLQSLLYDYEDLLLNDGCTGVAVLNPDTPQEVQFDEHKMLLVYGEPLAPFEEILRRNNIRFREEMRFITEAEHVHSSSERFMRDFEEMKVRLGIENAFV